MSSDAVRDVGEDPADLRAEEDERDDRDDRDQREDEGVLGETLSAFAPRQRRPDGVQPDHWRDSPAASGTGMAAGEASSEHPVAVVRTESPMSLPVACG